MVDEVLSIFNVHQHQNNWILDFGASHDMFLHRSWLLLYQSIDEGVVYMGNDISCKFLGIRSVKIRMYDGTMKKIGRAHV